MKEILILEEWMEEALNQGDYLRYTHLHFTKQLLLIAQRSEN